MFRNLRSGRVLSLCFAVLLAACAIKQDVRPVSALDTRQVCVIVNPDVRKGFEESLHKGLRVQGYETRALAAGATVTSCPVTVTYTANWRWDLATYMAYAEIRVFNAGNESGRAIYDSTRGGGNMGKFIDADKKIAELLRELFPRV